MPLVESIIPFSVVCLYLCLYLKWYDQARGKKQKKKKNFAYKCMMNLFSSYTCVISRRMWLSCTMWTRQTTRLRESNKNVHTSSLTNKAAINIDLHLFTCFQRDTFKTKPKQNKKLDGNESFFVLYLLFKIFNFFVKRIHLVCIIILWNHAKTNKMFFERKKKKSVMKENYLNEFTCKSIR